jgi:hypothetical protein
MAALHAAFLWVVAVAAVLWVATGVPRGRAGGGGVAGLANLLLVAAAGLAALGGLALLVTGHRPRDPLHLLYGVLIPAVVPVTEGYSRRRPDRVILHRVAGGVVVAAILFRLQTTG